MTDRVRTVWITGVSSGLGASLARTYLDSGWRVFGSSRPGSRRKIAWQKHAMYTAAPMDIRRPSSVSRAWERIRRAGGVVDVLVNNAGVTAFKEVLRTTPEEFTNIVETNLTGLHLTATSVLPSMRRRKRGMIVNILSYAAKTVYTRSGAYAASKAGADMYMKVLREEQRGSGIRVVNVFPGAIATPMWSAAMRRVHGKSMMSAEELAGMIVGLTSGPSSVVPEELVLRPEIGDLTV